MKLKKPSKRIHIGYIDRLIDVVKLQSDLFSGTTHLIELYPFILFTLHLIQQCLFLLLRLFIWRITSLQQASYRILLLFLLELHSVSLKQLPPIRSHDLCRTGPSFLGDSSIKQLIRFH